MTDPIAAVERGEALERAREAVRIRREAGETIARIDPILRARQHPTSRRHAITAMCCTCMGGGEGEAVPRRDIRECTAPRCPLYALRPYQQRAEVQP